MQVCMHFHFLGFPHLRSLTKPVCGKKCIDIISFTIVKMSTKNRSYLCTTDTQHSTYRVRAIAILTALQGSLGCPRNTGNGGQK